MGVAGTWTGRGPRDLGQKINEMLSYALYLSNMVSEHRNGAIMQKRRFSSFYLYKKRVKNGRGISQLFPISWSPKIFFGSS